MHDEKEASRRTPPRLLALLILLRGVAIFMVLLRAFVVGMVLLSILSYSDNFATGRDYSRGFDYRLPWMRGSRPGKIYPQAIRIEAYWTFVHGGLAMLPFLGIAGIVSYVKKSRLYFLTASLVAIASPLVIGTIVQIRGGGYQGDAQQYSSSTWLFFFIVFTGWAWLELWVRERRSLSIPGSGYKFSLQTIFLAMLALPIFMMIL